MKCTKSKLYTHSVIMYDIVVTTRKIFRIVYSLFKGRGNSDLSEQAV